MRSIIQLVCVTITIQVSLLVSAYADNPLKPIQDQIEEFNYYLYQPPRTNRGPGYVFTKFRDAQGRQQISTVCKTFNEMLELDEGQLFLSKTEQSQEIEVGFGLKLLKGLINSIAGASAKLEGKRISTLKLTFGSVTEKTIPESEVPNGTPQEVSKDCNQRVMRLIGDGGTIKGQYQLWFIQKALITKSLQYDFSTEKNLNAGAELTSLRNTIDLSGSVSANQTNDTSLKILVPDGKNLYIGYVHRQIRKWRPAKLVSPGDFAEIEFGEDVTSDPFADIVDFEVPFEEALKAQ